MKISDLIKTAVARTKLFYGKTTPLRVTHFITTRCNLKCVFCGCHKIQYKEMSPAEIKDAMRAFKKVGTFAWGFTGGEPFLRDDLPELFGFAKGLGFYTSVVTNGILTERIKQMSARDIDFIMVSFHGREERAESIYGKNRTAKVIETIDFLCKNKFNTCLSSTYDANSFDDIKYIIEYSKSRQIYCSFEPVYDFSTQLEDKNQTSNPANCKKLMENTEFLIALKKQGAPIWNSISYLKWVRNYGRINDFYCYAGKLYVTIMPDGTLRRCLRYGNKESSGNFMQDFKKLNMPPHRCYCYPWCHIEYSLVFSLNFNSVINSLIKL